MDHPAWDAHNGAVALHVAHHHGASADSRVGPDRDGSQNFGACSHHHVFGKGGVAFAVLLAGAPQSDPLVQQATVADFGGFADHHPHAVVNEHAVADACTGVNFDAGEGATDLTEAAGRQL